MTIEQIFDGLTLAGLPTASEEFVNADFLVFATPTLGVDEGYEISLAIKVVLPALGERTLYEAIADTKDAIRIPSELGQTGLTLKAYLATPYQVAMQMYVINESDNSSTAEYVEQFVAADLTDNMITIVHGRNKNFPIVQLYDGEAKLTDRATISSPTENTVLLDFTPILDSPPITGTYTVRIA